MLCKLQSAHGSLEPPKAMSWSGTTCTAMYCGGRGCGQRTRATPGPEAPHAPSLPGVTSLPPSPGPPRPMGTPPSCSRPANLGRLASGLCQLLGELGEEPVWHGGAGHVGIHHEHRHDDGGRRNGEDWSTGRDRPTCKDAAREAELRDRRPGPPRPSATAAPPPVTLPPAEAPPPWGPRLPPDS